MARNELEIHAEYFQAWYRSQVRGFIDHFAPDLLPQLDDHQARLERWLGKSGDTVVCMLGVSRIGKSTLLNTLVDPANVVAPAGGVGPLTALATEVRHSPKRRLRVTYQPMGNLWKLVFALRQRARLEVGQPIAPAEDGPEIDEVSQAELTEDARDSVGRDGERPAESRRMEDAIRQARLMVAGGQNEERSAQYLADALALACSKPALWNSELSPEDKHRVDRIARALEAKVLEFGDDVSQSEFTRIIREHAAGFLAPLIERLEVGWPSEVLRDGLVLVDLPGVGVAKDLYKEETRRFVAERARAVIVVVDSAGPTESVVDMLRSTGYWSRLLLSSEDPMADPCNLILVVTKVDDLANEHWIQMDRDAEGKRPRKADIFQSTCDQLRESMKKQLEALFKELEDPQGSETVRRAGASARQAMLDNLVIHPVSAPEYRRILLADDDDRAFIRDEAQSGIPGLAGQLSELARSQVQVRVDRIREATEAFAGAINSNLEAIEQHWTASERTAQIAAQLRKQLDDKVAELAQEYNDRRSSFREFLRQTVPAKIEASVLEAKSEAGKDVRNYLGRLRDAHWATLRAAVRRGGTFFGSRHIDLPGDIATRFQDPVAAVWSQRLLKDIRERTYALAKETRQMVEELCDWASTEAGAFVDPKVVETQRNLVSGQAEQLRAVGKDAIEELRGRIKEKVLKTTEKPIRAKCEEFVRRGDDIGPGVKNRILDLFDELSSGAIDAASHPAKSTLIENYSVVREEIQGAFRKWEKPLERAADALIERHEAYAQRSDAQKRARVLAALGEVRAAQPAQTD